MKKNLNFFFKKTKQFIKNEKKNLFFLMDLHHPSQIWTVAIKQILKKNLKMRWRSNLQTRSPHISMEIHVRRFSFSDCISANQSHPSTSYSNEIPSTLYHRSLSRCQTEVNESQMSIGERSYKKYRKLLENEIDLERKSSNLPCS